MCRFTFDTFYPGILGTCAIYTLVQSMGHPRFMPSPVRTFLTALAVPALFTTTLFGQGATGVSVIRSNQTAILGTVTLNSEAGPRDFVLTATEGPEPGWFVVYRMSGVTDITDEIISPGGITLSIPPAPQELAVQAIFLPAGALEGSVKTVSITAVPTDGKSPPQVANFRVRMLNKVVVNDDRDLQDADPNDEFIDVDPVQPGEQTTLRAAIEFCNNRGGLDCIGFNIPGPGIPRILPQTPLPEITDPVEIDGSSQPTAGLVGVEISGEALTAANSSDGLVISGGGSTVRGLALTRFRSADFGTIPSPATPNPSGILLKGNGGNTVESCLLGLHPSGTIGAGNEGYGIRVESSNNTITGCSASGNWVGGVGLIGPGATENMVTCSVGGDVDKLRSSNFLDLALVVNGVPLSPLRVSPSFVSLDSNLANGSIHFAQLNQSAPWESSAAGFLGGIVLHDAPRNTLTACTVQGNGADGIRVIGDATDTILRDNIVGQPLDANPTLKNTGHGIALECDHASLLGDETSGNELSGVLVRGSFNVIEGLVSSRNGGSGIRCEGMDTTIGRPTFQGQCQIFSNANAGILITAPTVPVNFTPGLNRVTGNLVGAESPFGAGHLTPRPNRRGIHIDGSDQNVIGGSAVPGEANTIAYNYMEGILITAGLQNVLYGNIVVENGRLDIDLSDTDEGDGPDLPDFGDPDLGGNNKTNAPTLIQIVQSPTEVLVTGTLQAGSTGNFRVELVIFFPGLPLAGTQFVALQNLESTVPVVPFSLQLPTVSDLTGAYLRAAVTDPAFNGSEYSEWMRIEGITQTDSDGVSDEIEDLVPSRLGGGPGDGNGDGQPDAQQSNIASLPLVEGGTLTIASLPGQNLSKVTATSTPARQPDSRLSFPHGTWSFEVGAGTATVTIFAPDDAIAGSYHNFGPTPGNPDPHWYEFLFDGTTGAQVLADRVVLHFVDGQRGDHDQTANGTIQTDGGMANLLPALPDPEFALLEDGSLVISWESAFPGLFLERTPRPDTTPWQFTTEAAFTAGASSIVRVFPEQGTELFRLVRP